VSKALRTGRAVRAWLGAVFLAVLIYQALMLPRYARNTVAWAGYAVAARVDPAVKTVGEQLDVKNKQLDALISKWAELADGNKINAVRVQSMMKSGAEILHYMRWQILPELKTVMTAASAIAESMKRDVPEITKNINTLLTSVDVDAKKVGTLLDSLNGEVLKVQKLTDTLDREITEGSDKAQVTLSELAKSLSHLDAILDGEDLKGILANSNAGSKSLAESMESVNQALMPLRKKLTLFKMILSKAVSMIKLDPSRW
jgi:hypothetical protein